MYITQWYLKSKWLLKLAGGSASYLSHVDCRTITKVIFIVKRFFYDIVSCSGKLLLHQRTLVTQLHAAQTLPARRVPTAMPSAGALPITFPSQIQSLDVVLNAWGILTVIGATSVKTNVVLKSQTLATLRHVAQGLHVWSTAWEIPSAGKTWKLAKKNGQHAHFYLSMSW